jgi:dolichol-phosphate mannosyltransferase
MKITVIIPTYNEEENIKILVPLLESKFRIFPKYKFNILFVDGNSKDGTVLAIKKLQKEFSNIELIEEKEKSGLGGAYIKGYKYSMEILNSDFVVEMDADLQHNPEDFPKLIEKINEGYDLVIGSRYIKGGSVPQEWVLHRKAISYFGSLFARVVLRIFKIKDFTSGFRLTKVKGILDQIDFSLIKSKGFAYKMDMLVRIYDMKAKIIEVPIAFGLRDRGTSKMEQKNFQDSLKVVLEFAKERNKNFIKFIMVGFGGLFVDATLFNLISLNLEPYYSALYSGFIAMLFTFLLNNYFSFKERKKENLIYQVLLILFFGIIFYFIPNEFKIYFLILILIFIGVFREKLKGVAFFMIYALSSSVPIVARGYIIYLFVYEFGDTLIVRNLGFFIGIFLGLIWNYTVYSKIIWKKDV